MRRPRASAVVLISVVVTLLLTAALAFPLALGYWNDLRAQRNQERDFVVASDNDLNQIVKSILTDEMTDRSLCPPSGMCPEQLIYFDQRSALLRSVDDPEPVNKYELRTTDRPGDFLAYLWDASIPVPLQALLGQLTQTQTSHSDPALPGIVFVGDQQAPPLLGEPNRCEEPKIPRLVRISSAAVQESEGLAVVLVARTFCDGSGSPRVTSLRRTGSGWQVVGR